MKNYIYDLSPYPFLSIQASGSKSTLFVLQLLVLLRLITFSPISFSIHWWVLVHIVITADKWWFSNFSIPFFFFFCFLGPHPRHMVIRRLGVKLELQLPACATATAAWDPSCICDWHCSSRQHRILNPLSKARDRTFVLMDTHWVRYHRATTGTPNSIILTTKFVECPMA